MTLTHPRFTRLSVFCFFAVIHFSIFASDWEVPAVMDGATPVTAEELSMLIKELDNLVIIDSRTHENENQAIIKGSHPLPYTSTSPDALSSLLRDKFTPVVFYCDNLHCPHSMKAIRKAVSYGYVNVYWFRGGISEWEQKGFPVENN